MTFAEEETGNAAALKSTYRAMARNKEAYLNEAETKANQNKNYERVFDETLAESTSMAI